MNGNPIASLFCKLAESRRVRGLVGLFAVAVLGLGVWGWSYVRGTEGRNLAKARRLLAEGELGRAQLLLEQAVQMRPGSVTAQVALAEFYDQVGAEVAISHWRQVLRLAPTDAHRWKLAACALRLGDHAIVREALDGVGAAARGNIEQHRVEAGLALAQGALARATPHFAAMARLEPGNARYRFNLASHRLALGEDLVASRLTLEELAKAGPLRVRATLELMRDAPRRWPRAADPEALLAAKLFDEGQAVVLRAGGRPGRARLLAHLKAAPLPEGADGAVALTWLLREGREKEAAEWLSGFPPEVRQHPAMLTPVAECAVRVRDWSLLEEALRRGAWGWISPTVLHEAFEIHARAPGGNRLRWQQLLEGPEVTRGAWPVLWRLAQTWGWSGDAERLLGAVNRRHPEDQWAWRARRSALLRRGDRAELLRFFAEWERTGALPEDISTERLIVQLLEDPERLDLRGLAERHAAVEPATPDRLAVRALLLRAENRGGEALRLLETQAAGTGARLARWWFVYGLLLAENGRSADARQALERVQEPLLADESALFERALRNSAAMDATPSRSRIR